MAPTNVRGMLRRRPNIAAANASMISSVRVPASIEPPMIGVTTTPANAARPAPSAQLIIATRCGL